MTTAAVATPPPAVSSLEFLADLPAFVRDTPAWLIRNARTRGPITSLPIRGGMTVITHPEDLRHVLFDHPKRYPRGASVDVVRPFLGNGLALADGQLWLQQRRTMQPAFNRGHIQALLPVMARAAARHADRLRDGERFDMHHAMMLLTRDIIVETMFSDEIGGDTTALDEALGDIEEYVGFRMFIPAWFPLSVPTPGNLRFKRAMATLERVLDRVVRDRRARGDRRDDLLDALLAARDPETGLPMSDRQLRDEVLTIFFAGHETTANTVTWTLVGLANHPAVAARVDEEIARVLEGRAPTADDIPRLAYTNATIRETLRLYSPAWMVSRVAAEDDVIRGHVIPKGTMLLLALCAAHRDPEFWPAPDTFDPDRFVRDPSLGMGTKNCAYLPFGVGQHTCIGNHFAMAEAVIILATYLQKLRLVVERPEAVRPKASAVLRVAGGLPVRAELRSRRA